MQKLDNNQAFELASPYPYTLAVTLDKAGRPNIMGLSWWMFTSSKPLMIAISVGHKRYTHQCLENHGEFVLCFPSEGQAKQAWLCGIKSGKKVDKFEATGFKAIPSIRVKPPAIDGATVAYECKVVEHTKTGDHTIFIAEVAAVRGDPEKTNHLFSIDYKKLIGLGCDGVINMDLSS
jgi:flavin reductase (DIM6/NTAB) family NADH-FMN oxidoreductase RutF